MNGSDVRAHLTHFAVVVVDVGALLAYPRLSTVIHRVCRVLHRSVSTELHSKLKKGKNGWYVHLRVIK